MRKERAMNKSTSNQNNAGAEQGGKADAIVDQAKSAVSNVAGQARDQVTSQLDARKDQAVEKIGSVADAIRGTGEKLKDVGPLGDVAGRAADGIERVADFFEDRQITDLVRDVERFARREPAIFLGGAIALGLIAGRFLKSSSHRSEGREFGSQGYAQTGRFGSFDDYDYDTYGEESFLSDDDLEDDLDSMRFGGSGYGASGGSSYGASYGSQGSGYASDRRGDAMRSTLPLGTPSAVGGQTGMGGGANLGSTGGASTGSSSGTSATPSPTGGITSGASTTTTTQGSGSTQGSSNIGGQSTTEGGTSKSGGTGRV